MPAFVISPPDLGAGWVWIGPYWRTDATNAHEFAGLNDLPGEADTIDDAAHHTSAQDAFDAGGLTFYHRRNTLNCAGHAINASMTDYSDNLGTPTVADLNAMTIGFYGNGATSRILAQSPYISGNYSLAAPDPAGITGGFGFLLSLAVSVIGNGLLYSEMPALARYIARFYAPGTRCRSLIRPDEYERAFQDWKAYRHPRFFLPAVA